MKKFLAVFLTACFIFALAGCAGKDNSVNSTTQNTQAKSKENKSNKVLVAYFSATGNTESVAKIIADNTNADVFEITPKNEYTDEDLDWTNDESRVSVEHNNPDKRNVELVTITPEKFDDYDTVFIGYPIWWGIAAWPVDSFVKGNDFSGKTVIPFCSSLSSGLGE
ncbi:MAG: flavodoxin, partial [Acutalibacteraceae bacterium]